MVSSALDMGQVSVRLAETAEEISAAQRVRYQVFFEEYGAQPSEEVAENKLDRDAFDDFTDHLIVLDQSKVVGTYRLLPRAAADRYGQFYSSDEFDITCLLNSDLSLLELGRSCVLPEYRTKSILQLLWEGIADYITERDIDLMFGCASLHSTDIDSIADQLSYLYHYHLSPDDLCPRALEGRFVDMDIIPKDELNAKRVFSSLPPIIKGYLRIGGTIGNGAVIDAQFNTTDVCVMVQSQLLTQRYRTHYERKMQRSMPGLQVSEG